MIAARRACGRPGSSIAALALLLFVATQGCGAPDPVAHVRELELAGSFEEALEILQALPEERLSDPELQYLYGVALARTGQATPATFWLRQAMESAKWLAPAGIELASANLEGGNEDLAIEAANRVLEAEPDRLEALLLRARAHASDRGEFDRALADSDRALEVDPGNLDAMMLRAVSLLGLKRVDDADEALRALESAAKEEEFDPEASARYCAMRALFDKERGDAEAAEERFDACLEEHPASFLVVSEAIRFFDGRGRPERTAEILRKAIEEAPTAVPYRRSLADRLREQGDPAGAEALLREGTELDNPYLAAAAWVELANHFHALEDYAAAASALERAVAIDGRRDPELLFDYADALVMAERYEDALSVAAGLTLPVHRDLVEGRVALEQGRPADALARFDAALTMWPNSPVPRYYAALAAERVGDFDRAVQEYRYSIRAGVEATDARLRLTRLHEAEGEYGLALAIVGHDASRRPPGLEEVLVGARIAARLGRPGALKENLRGAAGHVEARARVASAVAEGTRWRLGPAAGARVLQETPELDLTDPGNAAALRLLVRYLAEAGRSADAVAAAEAGLAKHRDAAVFHEIHGHALAASGAPPDAVRTAYSRAAELDPRHSADALSGLGRIAAKGGDPEAALDFFARAAAADPGDPEPLQAAAETLLAQGRGQEAEQLLAEALERDPYDATTASRLALILVERDGPRDRALALARSAARFGRSAQDYELLARVHAWRGESELAAGASARAEAVLARRRDAAPEPAHAGEGALPR